MEAVYLISLIAACWVAGMTFISAGPAFRFPLTGTFAVALVGIVGYNSRWVEVLPPQAAPLVAAVVAGALAWAGVRYAAPKQLVRRRDLGTRPPVGAADRKAAWEGRQRVRGLPVTSPGFGDVSLREVMTPKTMIVGVKSEATAADAVRAVSASGHSRLAVYQEDMDHIIGMVHVYGLLTCTDPSQPLKELARPPLFVPESKKCFGMLEEFLREGEQFAVVLDEFGGTAGVVTVEDLLEELVGDMADEHERDEAPVRRMSDGSYLVPGHIRIDELKEKLSVIVPEGDYETLSGFVLDRLGRVPARGEKLTVGETMLEIAVSTARRIVTVKVVTNGAAGPGGRGPGSHLRMDGDTRSGP